MKRFILLALLFTVLAIPVCAEHIIPPYGYGVSEILFTGFVGGFDVLSNGNFIVFEGQDIYEITPYGTRVSATPIYSFESTVWGSFVRVDENSGRIYFGESGNGTIKSIALDGSDLQEVATVPFNYDFVLGPEGNKYVVSGSSVYLLGENGPDEILRAPGASGPVAVDVDGNLYYGTASSVWGTIGGQCIVKFSAEQVAGAVGDGVLSVEDGIKLQDDIDGPSSFAIDSSSLYYTQSIQYPGQIMKYSDGVASIFATADPSAGYSWITTIRTNAATGAISVLVGTSDMTYITTLSPGAPPVPEPCSIAALALGLGAIFVRRRR